jgi:hypothetical protein
MQYHVANLSPDLSVAALCYSAYSIRDRSDELHIKSGCMATIFTDLKSLNESLANVGVHVCQ